MTTEKAFNWLLATVIALLIAASCNLPGPSDSEALNDQATELEAIAQDEAAQASRDFAAQQVCGNGAYTWADDKTLVCQVRKPLRFASVKP